MSERQNAMRNMSPLIRVAREHGDLASGNVKRGKGGGLGNSLAPGRAVGDSRRMWHTEGVLRPDAVRDGRANVVDERRPR